MQGTLARLLDSAGLRAKEKTATGRPSSQHSTDHVLDADVLCVAAPLTAACLPDLPSPTTLPKPFQRRVARARC